MVYVYLIAFSFVVCLVMSVAPLFGINPLGVPTSDKGLILSICILSVIYWPSAALFLVSFYLYPRGKAVSRRFWALVIAFVFGAGVGIPFVVPFLGSDYPVYAMILGMLFVVVGIGSVGVCATKSMEGKRKRAAKKTTETDSLAVKGGRAMAFEVPVKVAKTYRDRGQLYGGWDAGKSSDTIDSHAVEPVASKEKHRTMEWSKDNNWF